MKQQRLPKSSVRSNWVNFKINCKIHYIYVYIYKFGSKSKGHQRLLQNFKVKWGKERRRHERKFVFIYIEPKSFSL